MGLQCAHNGCQELATILHISWCTTSRDITVVQVSCREHFIKSLRSNNSCCKIVKHLPYNPNLNYNYDEIVNKCRVKQEQDNIAQESGWGAWEPEF